MAILEILGVIASPIVGIIGGVMQRRHEAKIFDSETERMRVQNAHEIALTELSMKSRAQETEQEIALINTQGSIDVLKTGIKAESDLSNIKWGQSTLGDVANFCRSMIRPLLTLYLTICVSVYTGYELLEGGINDENRLLLVAMVDAFLLTLGFWFASRWGSKKTTYNDGTYSRG